MAKRGPMPKHPDRRQNRNQRPDLLVLHGLEAPDPPKGLLKATAGAWSEFWSSDVSAVVSREDLSSLERLFRLRDEWERYRRQVRKAPTVKGSQGQPVENPLAKRMDRLMGEIRQLEDRFGMNPTSRARLIVSAGQVERTVDDLNRGVQADDDALHIIDVDTDSDA